MAAKALREREVFHLAFLRLLARSVPPDTYVLKGGTNLRFFFGSIRYSEDMDIDVAGVAVHVLRERVMAVLGSSALAATMRTYGIEGIRPPDLSRAKQTETVQRFKVHLLTTAGEDLSTKVEFSRRGFDAPVRVEPVSATLLAAYRMPPLLVPHYTAEAAIRQKVRALASRRHPEARDVFDLFTLGSQPEAGRKGLLADFDAEDLEVARDRTFAIDYPRYRDGVVAFLSSEDRPAHDSSRVWDEIRLRAIAFLENASGREA